MFWGVFASNQDDRREGRRAKTSVFVPFPRATVDGVAAAVRPRSRCSVRRAVRRAPRRGGA
jgi:hypothetical protein